MPTTVFTYDHQPNSGGHVVLRDGRRIAEVCTETYARAIVDALNSAILARKADDTLTAIKNDDAFPSGPVPEDAAWISQMTIEARRLRNACCDTIFASPT